MSVCFVVGMEKCGKLIKMDLVNCWEGGKAKGKGKERYLFLCDNFLVGTKKKDENDTGHKQPSKSQKHPSYTYKFHIKISDLGNHHTFPLDLSFLFCDYFLGLAQNTHNHYFIKRNQIPVSMNNF